MRLLCKHNTWKIQDTRKDSQVVLDINRSKTLPRRGRRMERKQHNMTTTKHEFKDPSNHDNLCNINGHIEENYWKLHP